MMHSIDGLPDLLEELSSRAGGFQDDADEISPHLPFLQHLVATQLVLKQAMRSVEEEGLDLRGAIGYI